MPKIETKLVVEILRRNEVEPEKAKGVVDDINRCVNTEPEKKVHAKKQYVIVSTCDTAGWVIQIEEGKDPALASEFIRAAAFAYNRTKKGKMLPVRSIGEAIQQVPTKLLKEHGVWVKTRNMVANSTVSNKLMKEAQSDC